MPPFAEPASPLRLFDLTLGLDDAGDRSARFGARMKLRERSFFGVEARDGRLEAFFDTQRVEFGVSERDGRVDLEGSLRLARVLTSADVARRADDTWVARVDGALRLTPDLELVVDGRYDSDRSGGGPPSLEDFIETGRLPPSPRPTRVVRGAGAGFLYQRETLLDLSGRGSWERVRTEAGLERDRAGLEGTGVWNGGRIELSGRGSWWKSTGRAGRTEALAALDGRFLLLPHVILSAGTEQDWQPGVERSPRRYRGGLTFYGRCFRFARRSDIGREVLSLARRAVELGYNERRVYDLSGLRALRDRLAISSRGAELVPAVQALYLAQVRERNVPQLGFEAESETDEVEGSETTRYSLLVGVPWRLAWPFSRGEDRFELLRFRYRFEDRRFPSLGLDARSHEILAEAELDRQNLVRLRWLRPGQTPQDIAFRRAPASRLSLEYVYALGR